MRTGVMFVSSEILLAVPVGLAVTGRSDRFGDLRGQGNYDVLYITSIANVFNIYRLDKIPACTRVPSD